MTAINFKYLKMKLIIEKYVKEHKLEDGINVEA
jgi:hypothetical protein